MNLVFISTFNQIPQLLEDNSAVPGTTTLILHETSLLHYTDYITTKYYLPLIIRYIELRFLHLVAGFVTENLIGALSFIFVCIKLRSDQMIVVILDNININVCISITKV